MLDIPVDPVRGRRVSRSTSIVHGKIIALYAGGHSASGVFGRGFPKTGLGIALTCKLELVVCSNLIVYQNQFIKN